MNTHEPGTPPAYSGKYELIEILARAGAVAGRREEPDVDVAADPAAERQQDP